MTDDDNERYGASPESDCSTDTARNDKCRYTSPVPPYGSCRWSIIPRSLYAVHHPGVTRPRRRLLAVAHRCRVGVDTDIYTSDRTDREHVHRTPKTHRRLQAGETAKTDSGELRGFDYSDQVKGWEFPERAASFDHRDSRWAGTILGNHVVG